MYHVWFPDPSHARRCWHLWTSNSFSSSWMTGSHLNVKRGFVWPDAFSNYVEVSKFIWRTWSESGLSLRSIVWSVVTGVMPHHYERFVFVFPEVKLNNVSPKDQSGGVAAWTVPQSRGDGWVLCFRSLVQRPEAAEVGPQTEEIIELLKIIGLWWEPGLQCSPWREREREREAANTHLILVHLFIQVHRVVSIVCTSELHHQKPKPCCRIFVQPITSQTVETCASFAHLSLC